MATPQPPDINNLRDVTQELSIIEDSLTSIGVLLQSKIEEAFSNIQDSTQTIAEIYNKNLNKSIRDMAKNSDTILKNSLGIISGQNKTKDINKQLLNLEIKKEATARNIRMLKANGLIDDAESLQLQADLTEQYDAQKNLLAKQLDFSKEIEDKVGLTGKLLKESSKIPIIGKFIDSEEALTKMNVAAAKNASKLTVLATGFASVGKSLAKNLFDPLTTIVLLFNSALKANKQIVELGKALGKDSYTYRQNLASAARSSSNLNVTTENLVGAFNEISQSTGYTYEYTTDQLETQIKLTKQVGLQADEAAQIQRYSVLNNQTSEKTYSSFVKGLVSARNQLRVGIDFKATLAEAVKVSGQLAANLGYNPERIAKAVVTAKAFGMTLDQVAKSGEALLNWESSIDNELKAELLTGKQLNLEKARYAALTGDQVTLAEELANQVGSAADFTKMNVLQQKALAESVGMTADELSNTLRKREEAIASGKSLAQITEEEAKQALERQTVQEKFNQAVLKLQDFFGNLVAGPLGSFLDILTKALPLITSIASVFAGILAVQKGIAAVESIKLGFQVAQASATTSALTAQGAMNLMKGEELATQIGIAAAWAVANPFKALAGLAVAAAAVGGVYALMKSGPKFAEGGIITSEINNATIGEAGPEAIIPLNSPKAAGMLGGNVDLTPMIAAINEVRASVDRLYNKNTTINMDSKQVGSTLVQSSYKLA
jgi:hypothetical protein